MEAVAAFVASQNLILWGFGLIVVVGLLGAIYRGFSKLGMNGVLLQNWEIFDRQNKTAWLKGSSELGIKVTFNRSSMRLYRIWSECWQESNLFFSAEDFD